jgi:hypothetical protein
VTCVWLDLAAFQVSPLFIFVVGVCCMNSFVGSCFARFVSFASFAVCNRTQDTLLLLFLLSSGRIYSGLFMFNTFILFNANLVLSGY